MFSRTLKVVRRAALELLLPPRCAWCAFESEDFPGDIMLCAECQKLISGDSVPRCLRCGMPASGAPGSRFCNRCGGRRQRFDQVLSLGSYTGSLRECVLRLKRPGHDALAAAVGTLLYARQNAALADFQVDAVLPVPMHWARRLARQNNSAELLAAAMAGQFHRPLLHRVLRRVRHTRKQGIMLRTARANNVRGAFSLRDALLVRGKRLLVVDDVLTTGATCDEVARVLKRAGATAVAVAVLARADVPYGGRAGVV